MTQFKTMPRDVLMKLLDGAEDTLTAPLQELFETIKKISCPKCDSDMIPEAKIDENGKVFAGDSHIPIYYAACGSCGLALDPATGIVVRNSRT